MYVITNDPIFANYLHCAIDQICRFIEECCQSLSTLSGSHFWSIQLGQPEAAPEVQGVGRGKLEVNVGTVYFVDEGAQEFVLRC